MALEYNTHAHTHIHTYGFGKPRFPVGDSRNVLPPAIQFFFFFLLIILGYFYMLIANKFICFYSDLMKSKFFF